MSGYFNWAFMRFCTFPYMGIKNALQSVISTRPSARMSVLTYHWTVLNLIRRNGSVWSGSQQFQFFIPKCALSTSLQVPPERIVLQLLLGNKSPTFIPTKIYPYFFLVNFASTWKAITFPEGLTFGEWECCGHMKTVGARFGFFRRYSPGSIFNSESRKFLSHAAFSNKPKDEGQERTTGHLL